MESRTQGSRPRPRTQKKSEAKAKDSLSEDRHSRGQGQECSRPRPRTKDTSTSALQKKRSLQKFFRQFPQKNVFQKIFQALHKILTIQKIVLSSSRGQANFRGLEASRPSPRPRTSKCVLEDSTSVYYINSLWISSIGLGFQLDHSHIMKTKPYTRCCTLQKVAHSRIQKSATINFEIN